MDLDTMTRRALHVSDRLRSFEEETYGEAWTVTDRCVGLAKDVGDLLAIVQELEGRRPPAAGDPQRRLAHELGDCLWVLLVLADRYDVELGVAFERTMTDIERAVGSTS